MLILRLVDSMDNLNFVVFHLISLCFFIIVSIGCSTRKKKPVVVAPSSVPNNFTSQKNNDGGLSDKAEGTKGIGTATTSAMEKPMNGGATTPENKMSSDTSIPESKDAVECHDMDSTLEGTKTAIEDEEEAKWLKDKNDEGIPALVVAEAALPGASTSKEPPDDVVLKTAQDITTKDTKKTDAALKVKKYEGALEVIPPILKWEWKEMTQKLTVRNNNDASLYVVKLKCSDNDTFKVHPVYGVVGGGEDLEVLITQSFPVAKRPNKLVIEVIKLEKTESMSDLGEMAEVFKRDDLQKDSIIVPLLLK